MATIDEIKQQAASVKNATQVGENTAERVGGALAGLAELAEQQDSKLSDLSDKVYIKDEEGNVQDTPFRVIENEEFIMAVVDSEDRLLFGIYRATGKPYYPLNEMQNEEFFAVWLDAANHVLLGIRRDGEIIGEIHAVNVLKKVISQIQLDLASLNEKVGTIDTNLEELLDVFSLQDNEEYLAVEQDAEGKILSTTNPDGSHYIHNAKSETIDAKVDKEDGKSLIDSDVAESHTTIEDPEGRTEITTDAEDKILGYRDSEGTRHEHKISVKHLELSSEAANEVNDAFKSAGIKMENPSDFSKDSHIELPIPRIAAQVRIYAPKLPTTKQDDIEAEIEYNDKDGNYFRKPVILNAQGQSSMYYHVKNMAIDINDGSEIKFGDFPTQDSFHLKKYYIDAFRGQCIVGYWLMEQVYKSRPIGQQYPYEYSYSNESVTDGLGDVKKDFFTGAKCHPDGFPIVITWVNSNTKEETWMGVYTWNLKKSKEVYQCNKKKAENIILDGVINGNSIFDGNVKWSLFEIRNPKKLKDINGNNYNGDNPQELSDTDKLSKKVKTYIQNLAKAKTELTNAKTEDRKAIWEKYFITAPCIDYFLVSQVLYNYDGFQKNWIWLTYDGSHWTPSLYDVDSIFGSHWNGTRTIKNSDKEGILNNDPFWFLVAIYMDEIKMRYSELRNKGIFSVNNIIGLLTKWLNQVGYANIEKDLALYNETPSYRANLLNVGWDYTEEVQSEEYVPSKRYAIGEGCSYEGMNFVATQEITDIPPLSGIYNKEPKVFGMYNSVQRVANWLSNRLNFLDKTYNFNIE